MTAPIALFVYNRPEHTIRTVAALKENLLAENSDLFVFSDGPRGQEDQNGVSEIRSMIKQISGFRSIQIIEQESNLGLANSIISGVSRMLNEFGNLIVLEDDLVTSKYFLKYMNAALEEYENEEKVISIHGFSYPTKGRLPETFFLKGADCWGWATWRNRWKLFESDGRKLLSELENLGLLERFNFDGKFNYEKMLRDQINGINNSWAVRWYASALIHDKLTLYPGTPLVQNIGLDGSGTHCGHDIKFLGTLCDEIIKVGGIEIRENTKAYKEFRNFFSPSKKSIFKRIISKLKNKELSK